MFRNTLKKLKGTYTLLLVVTLCVTCFVLNIAFAIPAFSKYPVEEDDKIRGILTDNVVSFVMVVLVAILMCVFPKMQIGDASITYFTFQEIVNFVCDNTLRSAHVVKHSISEEKQVKDFSVRSAIPENIANFLNTQRTLLLLDFEASRLGENCIVDSKLDNLSTVTLVIRRGEIVEEHQLRFFTTENDYALLNFPRDFQLSFFPTWGHSMSDAVFSPDYSPNPDTASISELYFLRLENDITAHIRLNKTTGALGLATKAVAYVRDVVGTRAVIVSVLSLFMASGIDKGITKFVQGFSSEFNDNGKRFLPLLVLWMSSAFASLPINTLRFGWAYKQLGNKSEISTTLVSVIFILVTAMFLQLHREEDDKRFPFVSKSIVAIIGLTLLVLLNNIPDLEEAANNLVCPLFISDFANSTLQIITSLWLSAFLTVWLYGYLMWLPLKNIDFELNKALKPSVSYLNKQVSAARDVITNYVKQVSASSRTSKKNTDSYFYHY